MLYKAQSGHWAGNGLQEAQASEESSTARRSEILMVCIKNGCTQRTGKLKGKTVEVERGQVLQGYLGYGKHLGFYIYCSMKPGRLRARGKHELPRLDTCFPSAQNFCPLPRPSLCFNKVFTFYRE